MADSEQRRLIISEDDLDVAEQPPATGDESTGRRTPLPPRPDSFPRVEGAVPRHQVSMGGPTASPATPAGAFMQTVKGRNVSAAATGIAAGWAVCEITRLGLWTSTTAFGQDITAGTYVGVVGFFFAVVYVGWEQILARNWEGLKLAAGKAGPPGVAFGFVSGFAGQVVYRHFVEQILRNASLGDILNLSSNLDIYLARAVAWGLFGLGMGVAAAGGLKSRDKLANGLIGGGIGGTLGGLVFNWCGFNISSQGSARLVGLLVVGAGIGLAIGVVEVARREAWLHITGGGMAGKEFILYGTETTVGSSPKCEINLLRDPEVRPLHFTIRPAAEEGSQARVLSPYDGATITVNGRPVGDHRLRSGDVIGVGATTISYSERALA